MSANYEESKLMRSTFAAWTGHFASGAARVLLEHLRAARNKQSPWRVMDAACGTGAATFALASQFAQTRDPAQHLDILATDVSPFMIDQLRAAWEESGAGNEGGAALSTALMDLEDCSAVPDGSLDGVLCTFGIFFPSDPDKAMREIFRVLAPGGLAVLVTWKTTTLEQMTVELAETQFVVPSRAVARAHMAPIMRFGEPEVLQRLFHGAGFSNTDTFQTHEDTHTVPIPLEDVQKAFWSIPSTRAMGTWDSAAVDAALAQRFGDTVPMFGHAIICADVKP